MDQPKSNLDFIIMSLSYKVRDFLSPRISLLKEVGIRPGFSVLDYGCGPGSYIEPLAKLVGPTGKIYALDISTPVQSQKLKAWRNGRGL